jgi:hypothetical protein
MAADIIKLKRVALFIENLPRWFMFFRVLSDASRHAATVASFWTARPQSHFPALHPTSRAIAYSAVIEGQKVAGALWA